MRERKYVKFRVDMYSDTKFKIIDRMPERDLVHYVWNRVVLLAGKVNREGDLYISKNLPYTIETLAIEFNRDVDSIKLAVDVFMQLEMIELTEDNVYRVKNFAKHQNIKVKEKTKSTNNEDIEIKAVQVKENLKNEVNEIKNKALENKIKENEKAKEKEEKNSENFKNDKKNNIEIAHKDIEEIDNAVSNDRNNNNSQDKVTILSKTQKRKKSNNNKKKDIQIEITDEDVKENALFCIYDGEERPLDDGESVVDGWSF